MQALWNGGNLHLLKLGVMAYCVWECYKNDAIMSKLTLWHL
jgi:hypothetical protein